MSDSRSLLASVGFALRGSTSTFLLALNTLAWASVLLPVALIKLVIPLDAVRKAVDPLLQRIAELWVANNAAWMRFARVRLDVRGIGNLRRAEWYLVEANHQSWADIFILQEIFNRRIPMLKFFLKQELIWVPLIGLAWWALDFPFMKRHSPKFLREHPERLGDDLARIRRSCEKFALIPTSVMNFLEGTRFTPAKQGGEESPYRHLLKPKAGGIALALNAMGERFHSLLDVTLFYPGGAPTYFQFASGKVREVVVLVRELPIPPDLIGGNYASDPAFRTRVQNWVQKLWEEKDQTLESLRLQFLEASR